MITNNILKVALVAVFVAPPLLEPLSDDGFGPMSANAQQQPPPSVQWVSPYTHEDDRSESGVYYNHYWDAVLQRYRNDPLPASEQNYGAPQNREQSGEDWWYGHDNYFESGQMVGIVTAGYSSWPNCWYAGSDYCTWPIPTIGADPGAWGPNLGELEQESRRKGHTRGTVARLDLEGNDIWYRHFFTGQIWNVIEDSEGNIIAAGVSYISRWGETMEPNDESVIRLNDDPFIDMNTVPCSSFGNGITQPRGFLIKLNPVGEVLWCTFINDGDDVTTGLSLFSELHDVVAVDGQDGPEYWVAGRASENTTAATPRPFLAHVSNNGIRLSHFTYRGPNIQGLSPEWPDSDFGLFLSIATDPNSSEAILSGYCHQAGAAHAITALVDLDQGPVPEWHLFSGEVGGPLDVLGGHDPTAISLSTGGQFIPLAGNTRCVVPMLANFSFGDWNSGRKEAELLVHGIDVNGELTWTRSLGLVRAYDLQSDLTPTSDGRIAVVCSKWSEPSGDGVFNSNDLPSTTYDCLIADFGSSPDGFVMDWQNNGLYDYWNTDAYVAKLDPATGVVFWETTWDADPSVSFECSPGDLRNQECMYKITEATDGGLIVSGNTSHNFDDYYLAKLLPDCQSRIEYDFTVMEALSDDTHTYTLQGDETWGSDKNLVGTIFIPDGITLSITNCTIRFADTEQIAWPTRIVVERGGRLMVEDATLTSIEECPNSLWDGIELRGNYFAQQTQANQGYLNLKNSTISNARTGVLTARGDFNDPLGAIIKESTGGIVIAHDSRFLNNIHDVVFRPFENRLSNGFVIPNESVFRRCEFVTDGGVPVEGVFPRSHVALQGVRGIPFRGCTWRNTLLGQQLEMPFHQGTGISSNSSSFTVADDCNANINLGDPCPPEAITSSSFTNLHRGILAITYKADKTFSVDNATFTGTNFGIRMEGIQDASITRCSFDVPQPFTPGIVGATYGVYSDECTGYRIQENAFLTQEPEGANKKVGLIIKDSGSDYNTFYNNTFDNLYSGSIIQGENAGTDDALGLEVKCNDYGLADANFFDNALTGGHVRVQKMQGEPINNPLDQAEWKNPAGNRFSLGHTGGGDSEEDWHVQVTATLVEYFYHTPTPGNRTEPLYSFEPNEIITTDQNVFWPNKEVACPGLLDDGDKVVKRLMAEGEHEEYESSKDAYDATKDNGDTYSLLGYVSDPSKSSTQVRNALQSVAPKVSTEVWQAAFERSPAMSAWHITQALLSNSPLQAEALVMVDDYGLPAGYASMVHAAQNGLNVLTLLESAMAKHGGNKAEALADLGRMSWLDEEDLAASLDALLALHEELPAENHALAVSGVLTAKGEYSALEAFAQAEESASDAPERYTLLKHYAQLEQQGNWAEPDEALRTWLTNLGQQRDVLGSAWANAWLYALGEELPEEVIVLPETGPKGASRSRAVQPVQWQEEDLLEVFPNPARNVAYVAFSLGSNDQAQLRVLDMHGRQLSSQVLSGTEGIATISLDGLGSGLYLIEVIRTDAPSQQARLVVQ